MAEIVGQEQELSPRSPTPSSTNNVQTISIRSLFSTASGPEPESFRTRIIETMKSFSLDTKEEFFTLRQLSSSFYDALLTVMSDVHIIETMKSFSLDTKEEFFTLRQLSSSFYDAFCPVYLQQLNKTLYIDSSRPTQAAELVTKIPKEIVHIFQEIKIQDLAFLTGGAEELKVMNSLQNIMPHIKKLDIYACPNMQPHVSLFKSTDKKYEKLIHFLKYFSFNGLFPRLEIIEFRLSDDEHIYKSFKNLFDTIPEKIQIKLNFETLCKFPEVISNIYSTKRANVTVTTVHIHIYSISKLIIMRTLPNFVPLQEWIQNNLQTDRLELYLVDILQSDSNLDWRALDGILRDMKFTTLCIYGYDPDPEETLDMELGFERYLYPDFLSMALEWKQQIVSLELFNYSHPLSGLEEFTHLENITIKIIRDPEQSDGAQILFPNLPPNPERAMERLRDVFHGLRHVNVEMEFCLREWRKVRKILNKEQLVECMKPLVKNFELRIWPDNFYHC